MAVVVITAAKEEVSERLLLIRCKDGVTFLSFGVFFGLVISCLILRFALMSCFNFYVLSSSPPGYFVPSVSLSLLLFSAIVFLELLVCTSLVCFSFLFGSFWIGSCLLLSLLSLAFWTLDCCENKKRINQTYCDIL